MSLFTFVLSGMPSLLSTSPRPENSQLSWNVGHKGLGRLFLCTFVNTLLRCVADGTAGAVWIGGCSISCCGVVGALCREGAGVGLGGLVVGVACNGGGDFAFESVHFEKVRVEGFEDMGWWWLIKW